MIKRKLLALFVLCAVSILPAAAQMMSVKSFKYLETDLEARAFSPKKDQNGQLCAIIKVVTTETGFTFDVGALGVTAVEYKTAEIWVYVPPQTSKIKIAHPRLGQLDTDTGDGFYWFPIGGVKAGCVYRLELISGRIVTTVEEPTLQTGYLLITTEPSGAEVYLTDEKGMESFAGTTPFQKRIPYGEYRFRLEKPLYYSEPGIAHVNSDRAEYPIRLRPKFGTLEIQTTPSGAKVVVEDVEQEYFTPCTIEKLPAGEHDIRITKEGYQPITQEVEIQGGKTLTLDIPLDARFASLTIQTIAGARIYIDGKDCGTTTYTSTLNEGFYEVEVRKASHKSAKKAVQVIAKQDQTVRITPTPIYGSLDVMSTPWDAQLTLNGEEKGTTPLFMSKLLIGDYTLTLSKEGYQTLTKTITVREGETLTLDETLVQTGHSTTSTEKPQKQPKEQPQKVEKQRVEQELPVKKRAALDNSFFMTFNGGCRFKTTPSIGLTIGQEIRRSGWYLTAATGFGYKSFGADYVCTNGGFIDSSLPSYTGKQNYSRLSISGGFLLRVHQSTAFYAGIGYGYNSLAWELQTGKWARHEDHTVQGLDAQIGLHFNMKGFVLRAGLSTTSFKTVEGTIGIGFAIKKK